MLTICLSFFSLLDALYISHPSLSYYLLDIIMAAVAPEWLFDTLQMIDHDYQPLMSKYSEQGNVILEEDFPAWDRFYRALVSFRRQFRDCYESRVQLLPLLKFLKAHGTEFKAIVKRISTNLRSLPEAGELPDKIVEIIYLGQQLEDDIIFVHTPRLCRPIYCTRSVITAALTAYQFGPSFDVVFNALIEFEKVIGEMSRPSLYDDVTLREAHQNYQQFMANRLDLSSPTCVARAIAVSQLVDGDSTIKSVLHRSLV
ncbi:hypothetical protein C8Q75DRAFT_187082 [Abortiporus biennis]|nr:hypothetical protein C8Q75DRAFT_187082 [Abortiporus biennis]